MFIKKLNTKSLPTSAISGSSRSGSKSKPKSRSRLAVLTGLIFACLIASTATPSLQAAGFIDFFSNIFKKSPARFAPGQVNLATKASLGAQNLTSAPLLAPAINLAPKSATFNKWGIIGLFSAAAIVIGVGVFKLYQARKERLEKERLEKERLEKLEKERLEKLEKERLEREKPSLQKNDLRSIKVDGIERASDFNNLGGDNCGYELFINNNSQSIKPENEIQKKSKFLDFTIDNWTKDDDSALRGLSSDNVPDIGTLTGHATIFAFMDLNHNNENESKKYLTELMPQRWHDGTNQYSVELIEQLKTKNFTQNELNNLRQEVIDSMSQVYELYLQIKEQYLPSFVQDFLKFIAENEYGKLIRLVQVTKKSNHYCSDYFSESNHPIIVAHLQLIPGTKKEKNKILTTLINTISEKYKNESKKIAFDNQPEYSLKINEFMYLTQSYKRIKQLYLNLIKQPYKPIPENILFDRNFIFLKGYEYYDIDKTSEKFESDGNIYSQDPLSKTRIKKLVKKEKYEDRTKEQIELIKNAPPSIRGKIGMAYMILHDFSHSEKSGRKLPTELTGSIINFAGIENLSEYK